MTREVRVSIPGRIVYVTGTVNGLPYVFTADGGKWIATVSRSADDVYDVNLTAIDDAGKEGHYSTTVYYGAQLITDRTERDVVNKTDKGFYNASDLNRVGYAVKFLAEQLNDAGYSIETRPKVDWMMQNTPTATQMDLYLENIRKVRDRLYGTILLPDNMERLTFDGANRIELALKQVNEFIENMTAAWYYSGEVYSGEV